MRQPPPTAGRGPAEKRGIDGSRSASPAAPLLCPPRPGPGKHRPFSENGRGNGCGGTDTWAPAMSAHPGGGTGTAARNSSLDGSAPPAAGAVRVRILFFPPEGRLEGSISHHGPARTEDGDRRGYRAEEDRTVEEEGPRRTRRSTNLPAPPCWRRSGSTTRGGMRTGAGRCGAVAQSSPTARGTNCSSGRRKPRSRARSTGWGVARLLRFLRHAEAPPRVQGQPVQEPLQRIHQVIRGRIRRIGCLVLGNLRVDFRGAEGRRERGGLLDAIFGRSRKRCPESFRGQGALGRGADLRRRVPPGSQGRAAGRGRRVRWQRSARARYHCIRGLVPAGKPSGRSRRPVAFRARPGGGSLTASAPDRTMTREGRLAARISGPPPGDRRAGGLTGRRRRVLLAGRRRPGSDTASKGWLALLEEDGSIRRQQLLPQVSWLSSLSDAGPREMADRGHAHE
jgi:hypothetical protein